MVMVLTRRSGKSVPAAELERVMAHSHRVHTRAYYRSSQAGDTTWEEVPVVAGEVILRGDGQPSTVRLETFAEQVIREDAAGLPLLRYDAPEITPWGGWLKVEQEISTPGELADDPIQAPLGVFRVEQVEVTLDSVTVSGSDALGVLETDDVPLHLQRIVKGQDRLARVTTLITEVWPPSSGSWGSKVLDLGPLTGKTLSAIKNDQWDTTRGDLIRGILDPANMELVAGRRRTEPLYRIRAKINPVADAKPVLSASDLSTLGGGYLTALTSRKDRSGVLNRVVVLWTQKNSKVERTKRTTVELTRSPDDDSQVQVGGRFGTQSEYLSVTDVNTEAAAIQRGLKLIEQRLAEATTLSIETSPMHGLETGDCISVRDRHGNVGVGWVRQVSIPLGQNGAWRSEIVPANLLDSPLGRQSVAVNTITVATNFKKWRSLNIAACDETCKTKLGWVPWAAGTCSITDTAKTNMTIKALATDFSFRTTGGYQTTSTPPVARATFSFGKMPETVQVRVTCDGRSVDGWKTIRKGHSGSVGSGEVSVKQGAGLAFAVGIEVRGATVGSLFRANEVRVEVPA